jgi:hypothetical protein
MIGLKTIAAVTLSGALVAIGAARGALDPTNLAHLSAAACFLVGLLASLALGLVAAGWRPEVRSRSGLAVSRRRRGPEAERGGPAPTRGPEAERGGPAPTRGVEIVDEGTPRELPAPIQRLLLIVGFTAVALGALGNHAAAKLVQLPDEMAAPSPSQFCMPEKPASKDEPPPPPPPAVEQPGCALVRRAFKLGYAKTLGSCAPKTAAVVVEAKKSKKEVCTRRQLDEPFLHYGFRRVSGAFGAASSVSPIAALEHRVDDVRTHIDFLEGLLADINHAITGSPHAAHHLWVNLPDPHPGSISDRFTGAPRCSTRYANLPLWRRWQPTERAELFEHVVGQLLFATRFGTTASCNDYVIHWDAPPDACTKIAAHPLDFLDGDALTSVRAVLDRRRRQVEIGQLQKALGRPVPPPPPPVSSVVSLACFVIGPAASAPTGKTVLIDGDLVALREVHVAAVEPTGDGPIDVYAQLAALLAGPDTSIGRTKPAPLRAEEVLGDDFMLARLDPLVDADPFLGTRWPLQKAELAEVFPYELHLHAFVDTFRRRYLSQRGRL